MREHEICKSCGQVVKHNPYEEYGPDNLFLQTPPHVWAEYRANGYTIADAIREEKSYA